MSSADPAAAREFALEVVRRLRAAGHQALWAGGCVRDQLLGQLPKDYDVATDALPDRIREVFGRRQTLAIGAAFGVITVLGPRTAGQIEVATFRRDAAYSDGRHPDSVSFTGPREDAQRRDFTINGLFYDPLAGEVIDYVGGQDDLARQVVRAIGDPRARIAEDKLRMLRAVRFAATFRFSLDPATRSAVREQADDLVIVSAERIAAEMRRMLAHPTRTVALQLLDQANLLSIVLPESATLEPATQTTTEGPADSAWQRTLRVLDALSKPDFTIALALLVREMRLPDAIVAEQPAHRVPLALDVAQSVARRWRLAGSEEKGVERLLRDEAVIRSARSVPWPKLQRVLVNEPVEPLLTFAEAVARGLGESLDDIEYCRQQLRLPPEQLDPPPLVTGDDFKQAGLLPGPAFRTLLEAVRDAQLEKRIETKDEALALARSLWPRGKSAP
jgi:poly(A) polymerase